MSRRLLLNLIVLGCLFSPAWAADPLVGKRVVVIKDQAPLAASGKEVAKASECTVFIVDKVDGEWLWIKSERAYLRRGDVVPFEDAIGHYTRLLETNKTANNYWNRAQIWRLKGELDIALGDMNDAIRLNSNESAWFNSRGILWHGKNEYDKAIADYGEAIRLNPQNGSAYSNRGVAWSDKKEYDKAIADHDESLKHKASNVKTGQFAESDVMGGDSTAMADDRAVTFSNRGWAWAGKGNYSKAIADYEEAIRLDPKYLNPRNNRRDAWEKKGDWDKVIADHDEAIQAEPKNLQLIMDRASAWGRKPDFAKKFADFELVTELDPKHAEAWNNKAWLRATCPDEKYRNGQQAVEYATKACELTAWKDGGWMDTLAAAYAETGDFDKAVEWQKKAIDLAPAQHKAEIERHLKLYQAKKPYRQQPAK